MACTKILTLPKEMTGLKVWRNLNLLTEVHEGWEVIEGRNYQEMTKLKDVHERLWGMGGQKG